uniref:Uncharacterized protein n=1 Tax=Romanomermis culicivorax TaxID=13658 RepID=A0A915L3A5_ROMCU
YIQCETKCQPPLVTKFCGAKAATTVQNLYLSMFHSIKSILSTVNIVREANSTIQLSLVCNGLPQESA